ncbi:TadE/TadG family type IV pilus assembly protein [Rhodoblastus sp.]|uniref:TadE/TadG family type IV pilus assembly protein n=1 Tax=Rhodoblastus sp. TaxID=1962975 RepID=UPI003F956335
MVEAALVLPLLLMITLGMFQFGMLLNAEIMVANAAAAGGVEASVSRGDSGASTDIASAVTTAAAGLIASDLTVSVCVPSTSATCTSTSSGYCTSCNFSSEQGQKVTVTVKYSCKQLFVFTGEFTSLNASGICPVSASVTEIVQ